MRGKNLFCFLGLAAVFGLSGCVVRTYQVTRERVDQEITGNQGYIMGRAPEGEVKERKPTRTTKVVEIELRSPIKFEKMPGAKQPQAQAAPTEGTQEELNEGNRGYIVERIISETSDTEAPSAGSFVKYTVQKGDTLQKISQKTFGTTKKWTKIYDANKDVLKGPNQIYPGQVIKIPVDSLKEAPQNLK